MAPLTVAKNSFPLIVITAKWKGQVWVEVHERRTLVSTGKSVAAVQVAKGLLGMSRPSSRMLVH
jgi:hypothetical protein